MLSVILPAREEEKYIEATLRRIRESLTLPHEIIVSDDGSTDRTIALATPLADRVVTNNGAKHSIARTRNAGARVARGEFLLFLDSDSRVPDLQGATEYALERFARDTNLLALTGPQWVYPESELFTDKIVFGVDFFQNWFINNVLKMGWGSGKLQLVRRATFEKVGGYDENIVFGEDFELFQRIARIGKTRLDTKLTVYHSGRRLHAYGIVRFWGNWIVNGVSTLLRKKAVVKDWEPIR